jgi:hypothetical protein
MEKIMPLTTINTTTTTTNSNNSVVSPTLSEKETVRFASQVIEAPVLGRDDFTEDEKDSYWWTRREIFLFELKKDEEEEWDIRNVLSPHAVIFIDVFLRGATSVWGVLFSLAILSVTIEKMIGNSLPERASKFIVQTVQPKIVTGLLILVGFYLTSGRFSAAKK